MDQSFQSTTQPARPKNWLVESILVTILCCLPFGIAGIVFATQVNSKYDSGDYAGALKASEDAGRWTKIGFWLGLVLLVLCIIMVAIWGFAIFNFAKNHEGTY